MGGSVYFSKVSLADDVLIVIDIVSYLLARFVAGLGTRGEHLGLVKE